VVVGEERHEKRVLQSKTPRASTRTSTLGGQRKENKTGNNLTGQTGASNGLTGPQGGLTGPQTGLTGTPNDSGNSSSTTFRTRSSFKKLLAKYEKDGIIQRHKKRPDEARVPSQRQHPVSNQILAYIKVIVLLCQFLSRSLHDSGRILVIIHLWIIVGCICSPIIFNILLYIQIVFHKDRLAIIWSKRSLIAAKSVRRM